MYFFLHVLPEVVSAVFSFLVEWFLFQEQPALYGGTLSPLVTAWLYMAMMLAVWLLPIFYDACRRKGGMISTALNLLPAEIIFGGEFLYRLPLVGVAVLLLCGVVLWLLWYECYRRNMDASLGSIAASHQAGCSGHAVGGSKSGGHSSGVGHCSKSGGHGR